MRFHDQTSRQSEQDCERSNNQAEDQQIEWSLESIPDKVIAARIVAKQLEIAGTFATDFSVDKPVHEIESCPSAQVNKLCCLSFIKAFLASKKECKKSKCLHELYSEPD